MDYTVNLFRGFHICNSQFEMSAFQSLPSNTLIEIFHQFGDVHQVVRTCSKICKYFSQVVQSSFQNEQFASHIASKDTRLAEVFQNACAHGCISMARMLLRIGRIKLPCGSAIVKASTNGHVEVVRFLLAESPDVKANYFNALWMASKNGHTEVVRLLLPVASDLGKSHFNLALNDASSNGYLDIVDLLLQGVADVKAKYCGMAITKAAINGHTEVVRLLLPLHDDEITVCYSALEGAYKNGHSEVVSLLQGGADVNSPPSPATSTL
jgi:hypothetical protein